jgi:hypothetical protein
MSKQQQQPPSQFGATGGGFLGGNFPPQNNQGAPAPFGNNPDAPPPFGSNQDAPPPFGSNQPPPFGSSQPPPRHYQGGPQFGGLPFGTGMYSQNFMQMAQQPRTFMPPHQLPFAASMQRRPVYPNPMQAAGQQLQQQQLQQQQHSGTFAGQVAVAIQPNATEQQQQQVPEKPKADDHVQQRSETNGSTKDAPERSAGATSQAAESSEHEDKPAATPTGLTPDEDNIPTTVRKRAATKSPAASPTGLSPEEDNIPTTVRKRPAAKSLIRRRTTGGSTTPSPAAVKPKEATKKRKVPTKKAVPRKAAKSTNKVAITAIFEGIPDEKLEGGWPNGWIKKTFRRQNGATKGGTDSYWYTPDKGIKLRSLKEVKRFMKALTMTNGEEEKAKKIYKTMNV